MDLCIHLLALKLSYRGRESDDIHTWTESAHLSYYEYGLLVGLSTQLGAFSKIKSCPKSSENVERYIKTCLSWNIPGSGTHNFFQFLAFLSGLTSLRRDLILSTLFSYKLQWKDGAKPLNKLVNPETNTSNRKDSPFQNLDFFTRGAL